MKTHTAYRQHTKFKDQIRERDHYTCQLCGHYGDQVDHIIPWAESHDSSPENLRVLCLPCNLQLRRKRIDASLSDDEFKAYIKAELAACSC